MAGGRKRKELVGRGLEISTPLREMPQTYFSLWCLGSRGFMGPPSPTMILAMLNCVSPLIDAEAVLQLGGRLQPGPHLEPGPALVPCLTLGSHRHLGSHSHRGGVFGGTKRRRSFSKITYSWERTQSKTIRPSEQKGLYSSFN